MREARDLHRAAHEVRIQTGGHEQRAAGGRMRSAVLVMTAAADGRGRPKRLAVGPLDGARVLGEILDGRRSDGPPPDLELVELDGELGERVREKAPDEVYVMLDGQLDEQLAAGIGARLLMDGVTVHLVLPGLGGPPVRAAAVCLGSHTCISLHAVPDSRGARVIRRALDLLGAGALLVVLSPLFALVSLLVWWKMGRPVTHAQTRVGQFGLRFSLHKFRSMVADAEQVLRASPEVYRRYVECDYKLPDGEDPRITPLGRFLRATSLDELPQLWNVLRGDMSLVGPRPVVPDEVAEYGDYARMLLRVKPGLTGAWQVGGRSMVRYPERARMDLQYVAARTLPDDVRILLRTVPAVLRRRGAL
jgi:lipopolysaccharide/colanic/teichoic acid biosynthesis glycosyltransferase